MNILNLSGTILGYPLGLITGIVSFLRKSRMFHPTGVVVKAEIKNLPFSGIKFPNYALMRFSSAWWKKKEWIDVLGISIRFTQEVKNEVPREYDQDLLFATIISPWEMLLAPFVTSYKDFFKNTYYTVSPFKVKNNLVYFKLTTIASRELPESRITILKANIHAHARFELWMRKANDIWVPMAELTLLHELNLDQRRLKFDPFLNGLDIRPYGFVHHLRIGAYKLGQFGRSLRQSV